MTDGYAKLASTIVTSSLWSESKETRLLFVTMLALKNKYGVVAASLPGLARIANLTIPETELALEVLSAPDPHSRTPDFEGRRIEKIEEGWNVLNHEKYKDLCSEEQRAEYQHKYYERRKMLKSVEFNKCQQNSSDSIQTDKETDKETKEDTETKEASIHTDSIGFSAFWNSYPKKQARADAQRAWNRLQPNLELQQQILSAIEKQKSWQDWQKDSGKFIPKPDTWLAGERWLDQQFKPQFKCNAPEVA